MYTQNPNPTGSLALSALLASLPLFALLLLLGGLRWKAQWAGLAALAVALGVAVFGYGMSLGQALDSGLLGMAASVLQILWITFNAIWIYTMTVATGHFAVLRRAFATVSDDQRVQAIVIAFSFGALVEALAGGGSPVAICTVMLVAIGFHPMKAIVLALVADTAPVAFGGLGNPITILGAQTGLSAETFGAMAGRQTAFLAFVIPFVLLLVADGRRGLRRAWPAALTAGLSFAVTQFVVSAWSYKLCDIAAALVSAAAVVVLGRVWKPSERLAQAPGSDRAAAPGSDRAAASGDSRLDVARAFAPYAIIIAVFALAQIDAVKGWLDGPTRRFAWPGLHVLTPAGKPVGLATYTLNWFGATGTLLFVSGLLTMLVLAVRPLDGLRAYGRTLRQFNYAIVTILCVFALAYVMNLSGQITTLGLFLAGAGAFFAFLSPIVGWFGVAITGTDAGSNALFAKLQTTAAAKIGESPILLGAANSSGGVLAKMVSPQNLAIGTAAAGLVGQEGTLFRKVAPWSVALLLFLCALVFLQSTPVLGWLIP
ncbi:L-lactate permease [Longispora fulva]|uniref:L-lactate permease n=1 Tax=Longispora fulva TaxID=619741 RepID=A0A8J7KL85_9ACTN|nr:L-lactate permease [Longispora fulva]MBG6137661.1 lactate permease [Longispora fulva]GIG62180.1 L-lactate permease [Longispora fulva]